MNPDYATKLVDIAVTMLPDDELALAIELIHEVLLPRAANAAIPNVLQSVKIGQKSTAFNSLLLYVNRRAREIASASSPATKAPLVRSLINLREKLAMHGARRPVQRDSGGPASAQTLATQEHTIEDAIIKTYRTSVGRSPVREEIEIWKNNFSNGLSFHEFYLSMGSGDEGRRHLQNQTLLLADMSDGEFVQTAFELIVGTGAAAWEIESWQRLLAEGSMTRAGIVAQMFVSAQKFFAQHANPIQHDGKSCLVMGTGTQVTAMDWEGQARAFREKPPVVVPDERYKSRFHIRGEPRVLVSAIASMYRGADFIEQFMDNLTSQNSFDDYCELIIIDADSPEDEYETIKRYLADHKNINYIRCNYRIGIYDAWNVGARAARGAYLTNTNMDDLRRQDSLELQAATLDNLPFVDVVYQDLYYTFDPRLNFDEIRAFGLQTRLPVISPHNMIQFNSPHNAPMWRKRLHDEIGYFDTTYQSAGDYEFWMRCLAAKKNFYKINDPHVVYYQNPKGLSTRPGGRGLAEAMDVHKRYCRKLMPEDVVQSLAKFRQKLDPNGRHAASTETNRYLVAQQALRDAARISKYSRLQKAK